MHLRTTSQSLPHEMSSIFWAIMMSFSCCRTSRTLRIAFTWMKCSPHQLDEYLTVSAHGTECTQLDE